MDAIDKLKQDVQEGRISAEALIDLIADLYRKLEAANRRIEELEKQIGAPPTTKLDEPFSIRAEEQRQEARGKKKRQRKPKGRRGRLSTDDKVAQAERTESVFPEGVPPDTCYLSHVRPVWRLENGRAVLVAYQVYRGPGNRYGQIPGVLGRSEYGLEIVTEIAYLVYIVGLSFDKVCLLLNFFQNLRLGKSQANALLYRLSRDWEHEFDLLCTLLAHSLVVHADETSWSLNSVWAFLSEKARVLLFGVHDEGRARKVRVLEAEIVELCEGMWLADLPPMKGLANDYRLLVDELMRIMLRDEMFTFVTAQPTTQPNGMTKPVDGTNNEAERTLRGAAQARVTGRTNKTGNGARRQTILTRVLESLRLYLPTFTLSSVLEELKRWWATGQSCFEKLVEKLKLTPPEQSVTDQLLPGPSG